MSARDDIGTELRALLAQEKKAGARLQLRSYTNPHPSLPLSSEGPFMLTGRDSLGRRVRAVGDEAFLCKMIRSFPVVERSPG